MPECEDVYLDTCFFMSIYTPQAATSWFGVITPNRYPDCLAFLRALTANHCIVWLSDFALVEAMRKIVVIQADYHLAQPTGQFTFQLSKSNNPVAGMPPALGGAAVAPAVAPIIPPDLTAPRSPNHYPTWLKTQRAVNPGFLRPVMPVYDDVLAFLMRENIFIPDMHKEGDALYKRLRDHAAAFDLEAGDAYHLAIADDHPPCPTVVSVDMDYINVATKNVYYWQPPSRRP